MERNFLFLDNGDRLGLCTLWTLFGGDEGIKKLGLDGLKLYTFQPTCTIQAHFELSIILKLGDLGRTCEREGKRVGVVVGVGNRKIDFEGSKKRGRGSKGHVQEIWAWG